MQDAAAQLRQLLAGPPIREMDHLHEGLDWHSFGTNDPLPTWENEGYELFSKMMRNLSRDFVRYVMHAEVKVRTQARPPR